MARKVHLPFLSIGAAFVLLVSVAVPSHEHLPFSVCGFYGLTDLPCPLCGLTRAFSAIGHGQMEAAWRFHPFSFALYAFTLATLAWPLVSWVAPNSAERALASPGFITLLVALAVGVVSFGVLRAVALRAPPF